MMDLNILCARTSWIHEHSNRNHLQESVSGLFQTSLTMNLKRLHDCNPLGKI